jgi:ribosomal protein L14E/L6E/L27E
MELQKGLVVRSTAGHDKGGFFVILAVEGGSAVICDGRRRPLQKAKRKNKIHLRPTNTVLPEQSMETNRAIRRALAPFDGVES